MKPIIYPAEAAGFHVVVSDVARVIDIDRRLPQWPFRKATGHAHFTEFSNAIEGPFGGVLNALAERYGDTEIGFLVLDPSPDYYREHYGSYSALHVPTAGIETTFWDYVSYAPNDDPTGAAIYTANIVALTGNSRRWAVWGERRWDLAILLAEDAHGAWAEVEEVDFVPLEEALDDFTEPPGKLPLPPEARKAFVQEVHKRGRGVPLHQWK